MRKYDTEMFKKRCYELYQLDWMRTHGYSLQDAFNMLREGYAEGCASGNIDGGTGCDDDFDAMEEYFEEQGFGGEIFVSENEFYDCEYQDVGYMEYLLPKEMFDNYRLLTARHDNSKIVITIEQVRAQALELKKYLSELETVYDCTRLDYDGYDETDTRVVINGTEYVVAKIVCDMFKGDYEKLKEAHIKIQAITITDKDAIDISKLGVCGATYNRETDDFFFNVGDCNYSHNINLLENVRLDNLDKEFEKLCEVTKTLER